jgi:hypothetical protein
MVEIEKEKEMEMEIVWREAGYGGLGTGCRVERMSEDSGIS